MKAKVSRDLRHILADPQARTKLIGSVLESGATNDRVTISTTSDAGKKSYKVKILGLRTARETA